MNYHRVLNRAVWSARAGSRELLGMLLDAFASRGPVVLAIDDTVERRRGKRIQAKGIYRDPVRSSDAHFVKASGLRWVSVMLLAPIPWAKRTWALPFLTALAPSERFCREHGRRHKKLTDWGRQLVLQARRWLPGRDVVLVADSDYAALEFSQPCAATVWSPSPACAWTRPSTSPRRYGRPARSDARGARAPGCPTSPRSSRPRALAWKADRRAGLVRRGRARRRDLFGHRGLAPRRPARRAGPLGAGARSQAPLRPQALCAPT